MEFLKAFNKKEKSGDIAKSRLQLVLFQDRMNISPQMLEMLKSDIIAVLANYMHIDEEELDIKIASMGGEAGHGDEGPALLANIPIRAWKMR